MFSAEEEAFVWSMLESDGAVKQLAADIVVLRGGFFQFHYLKKTTIKKRKNNSHQRPSFPCPVSLRGGRSTRVTCRDVPVQNTTSDESIFV